MNLSNAFKFARGNALTETVLSAGDYPASGSYIDVSGYPWVTDYRVRQSMPVFLPSFTTNARRDQCTADIMDATYAAHTCAANEMRIVTFASRRPSCP
jgi:hypothetical protein